MNWQRKESPEVTQLRNEFQAAVDRIATLEGQISGLADLKKQQDAADQELAEFQEDINKRVEGAEKLVRSGYIDKEDNQPEGMAIVPGHKSWSKRKRELAASKSNTQSMVTKLKRIAPVPAPKPEQAEPSEE